jgi:two-component system response regulator TctD
VDILLVEDDLNLSGALSRVLAPLGFNVVCCADGLEALTQARAHRFDAVLLDLSLPGIDGLEMLQRLRDGASSVPVMVITARGGVEDKVLGFNVGADDYLAKPFDVQELEARLRALVRRSRGEEELHCGSLRFDRQSGIFFNGHRPLDLPPRETALLKALMLRRGQAVAREALRDAVFGSEADTSVDAVEVLVHRLRKRLAGASVELMTLRGVGYLLIDQALAGREE